MATLATLSVNEAAFLDMLAYSEIGQPLLANSDNGYNVLVGEQLFTSYADHPRVMVRISRTLISSAAGRYQILEHNFDVYKKQLHLPDFSPSSQDAIAHQLIRECLALADIELGNLSVAIRKTAHIWASLPHAGYGQHENDYATLEGAYLDAGGQLNEGVV